MKLGIPIGDASLTTSKDNALLIILEHYTKSSQAPLEHTAFDVDDGNRLHKSCRNIRRTTTGVSVTKPAEGTKKVPSLVAAVSQISLFNPVSVEN
jgi:hypothetical protein